MVNVRGSSDTLFTLYMRAQISPHLAPEANASRKIVLFVVLFVIVEAKGHHCEYLPILQVLLRRPMKGCFWVFWGLALKTFEKCFDDYVVTWIITCG